MKHLSILILCCVLAALLLTGCTSNEPEILFDEASEGIVSVILEDTNDGTIHYDTIGPDGQRQPSQPFESDPIEIFTADHGCFEIYHNDEKRTFSNRLIRVAVFDENDQPAEVTEPIRHIFELVEQQVDHMILELRILRQGEQYFVTADLNVNFWSPHSIYYFDATADTLIELYTYDATEVTGIRILNLPRSSRTREIIFYLSAILRIASMSSTVMGKAPPVVCATGSVFLVFAASAGISSVFAPSSFMVMGMPIDFRNASWASMPSRAVRSGCSKSMLQP